MDTPGFDPEHAEAIFQEIVRGIQSIPSTSQIVGFLYFTCINQPRFDSFDRKVLQVVCAMCGHNYIPCVTFITTFWTAEGTSQQANFDTQLRSLKVEWKKAFSVEELHSYKHGRGYHTAGTVAEPFINWFDDSGRNQMAQHARNMIARRYCGPNISRASENTPKIVHELRRGTPIHETEAGRVLGLQPAPRMRSVPTFNQQPQGDPNRQSSSAASSSNAQSDRKDSQDKDFRDIPRTSEDGTQPTQVPERNALQTARQIAMECCHWFFQNVQFNIDIGGPRGNMTPAMRSGYGESAPVYNQVHH
ncbi:hypothetical protein N7468_003758 [Penicillium chermesinum]|uniref:Uncharacterized protein n=1 Tax=Penicillium chermesinum TaxID=63820 RepID=A0A9W9TTP5_9EURO|nr:uncharacterized protein N7468_003758 [Penicillium chermesinum]KAJ5239139.1 hypothetical protein N7468_003758 [Penicillium chermesinum]